MADPTRATLKGSLPGFADYLVGERRFSAQTIRKYKDNLSWIVSHVGDLRLADITLQDFITLKTRLSKQGTGESHTASIICALKALLRYANHVLDIPILDLGRVKLPRAPRREVVYLTNEELEQFIGSIPLRSRMGEPRLAGYAFRALVETLAATGVRISEALSLNRDSINLEKRTARVIGKGNKERTIHFTPRSLTWIGRYLQLRKDSDPALFASKEGRRMTVSGAETFFKRHARWIGMKKCVTPHVIRHTTATNLLRNGCPIGYIKEILGHNNLETTCRFYLGVISQAEVEKAHQQYSDFSSSVAKPCEGTPGLQNPLTPTEVQVDWKHL